MGEARRECRRYRRGQAIIGEADLREVDGPANLVVVWMKRLTVEAALATEPYPHYPVNADSPWEDFERQAGLADVGDELEFDVIPCGLGG